MLSLIICTSVHSNEQNKSIDNCDQSLKSGDYKLALNTCNKALTHSELPADQLTIMLKLVSIHHELGNSDSENKLLSKINSHPAFSEFASIQYEWHRKMGQKNYFSNAYEQAKHHLYQALSIAKNENNPIWLSISYNDVGLIELKLENFKNALGHYQKSLNLKKQHGTDYQVAKTLNNLGLVHMKLELFTDAVKFYEDALQHYLRYTEQPGFDERVYHDIAHIYEDLNRAYLANNDNQKAEYYADAIVSSLKLKISPQEQARALINLAKWHTDKGNLELSQRFINEAVSLVESIDNSELMANLKWLQSEIYWQQEQPQKAEMAALEGLELAKALENDHLITDFYQQLGIIYRSSNPQKALDAMEQYQQHREIFLKKKYDSDLRSIQHEIEKQQIEQQLLNQKLANIEQKNKIQRMTNIILWIVIIMVIALAIVTIYLMKKRKEKEALIKTIHYHKQQLLLLETSQDKPTDIQEKYKEKLKKQLVTTMVDAVSIWEKSSQSTQIDLAEQSKIWTVSIDNGTLRTRSLDKYLSVDKIPHNPRWRNVVKTCHFILSKEQLANNDRFQLNQHLEYIMETVKNLSLSTQKT